MLASGDAQTVRWTKLAEEGAPAPGIPGAVFSEITPGAINSAGTIVFRATVEGPGITNENRRGLWIGNAAGFALAMRQDQDLLPQVRVGVLGPPQVNDSGLVAIAVGLQGPGVTPDDDEAIVYLSGGQAIIAIRKGTPFDIDRDFGVFDFQTVRLNANGEVSFEARLSDPLDPQASGYFAGLPGGIEAVAIRGDPAPGTGGLEFTSADGRSSDLRRNVAGAQVVVRAFAPPREGLWRGSAGSIQPIALNQSPAPVPGGFVYFSPEEATIGPEGEVIFRSSLTDGNTFRNGIFRFEAGSAVPLLVSGAQAPGLSGGVLVQTVRRPFINSAGRIGFSCLLSGAGVTDDNRDVLYAEDGRGFPLPILRTGVPLPGAAAGFGVPELFTLNQYGAFAGKNLLLARVRFAAGGSSLLLAELGIPETRIRGPRVKRTRKKRFVVRGRAFDDEAVVRVEVRVRKQRWRRARGKPNNWRFPVRVRQARTPVRVRSIDIDHYRSEIVRTVIRRRR